MTAYDEAIAQAKSSGRAHFVNLHRLSRDETVLLAETCQRRDCCAVAHPDGRLDFVVQGYSHAVAMTAHLRN